MCGRFPWGALPAKRCPPQPQVNIEWKDFWHWSVMTLIACRVPITEPFRIHIAPGWFFMGSEVGQTAESPVHRVCLDSFPMAATQVTLEAYARFLDATGNTP